MKSLLIIVVILSVFNCKKKKVEVDPKLIEYYNQKNKDISGCEPEVKDAPFDMVFSLFGDTIKMKIRHKTLVCKM